MKENTIQDIASTTATTAAQTFLNAVPDLLSQAVSSLFLSDLEEGLQAELQALIHSRLLWAQQAVQLELVKQQRLQKLKTATSESSQSETAPQRLVPASRPVAKHHTPTTRKVIDLQKPLPATEAGVTKEVYGTIDPALVYDASQIESQPASPLQYTQLDLLALSEPEPLKAHRRRPVLEPSGEEILKQYDLKLEDFGSNDPDATPRRRRRRAAAGTG